MSICKIQSGECCKSFGLISAQESLLIPMVLQLVEGKTGISDEPQHNVMGKLLKNFKSLDKKNTTLEMTKILKI